MKLTIQTGASVVAAIRKKNPMFEMVWNVVIALKYQKVGAGFVFISNS